MSARSGIDSLKCPKSIKIPKQRRHTFDTLRNLGDFVHNVKTLNNQSGILLIGRRPQVSGKTVKWILPMQILFGVSHQTRNMEACKELFVSYKPTAERIGVGGWSFSKDCKLLFLSAGVKNLLTGETSQESIEFGRYYWGVSGRSPAITALQDPVWNIWQRKSKWSGKRPSTLT